MNKIKDFSLTQMRNGSHFLFMDQVLKKAEADSAVSSKAATYVSALRKALAAEDEMLKVSTKNKLTDLIAQADACRDGLYRSLKNVLPGFRSARSAAVVEAASDLTQLLKDYRIDPDAPMLVETGMMLNLVQDLESKFKAQVETLGLSVLVGLLKDANNELNDLMVERTESRQNAVVKAMPATRKVTDAAYNGLVGMVNALVYIDGEEAYADFISFVNAQIVYYRREALKQRTSLPKSDGTVPGSGNEGGSGEGGGDGNPGSGSTGDGTGGNEGGGDSDDGGTDFS